MERVFMPWISWDTLSSKHRKCMRIVNLSALILTESRGATAKRRTSVRTRPALLALVRRTRL